MKKVYDISISVLALISVALAIMDITKGITGWLKYADYIIYAVFLIDYFVRLFLANKKLEFFKKNIFDMIAILPFNSALRAFRILKISKLSRVLKITKISKLAKMTKAARLGAVLSRFLKKSKRFFDTNGLKYVCMLVGVSIVTSAFLMVQFEGMNIHDALWWSFVTTTTVGYGDLSPSTAAGRVIACILMLIGIGLVGSLTSAITSFFLSDQSGGEDDPTTDNSKIKMCMVLYNELNKEEKEIFIKTITSEMDFIQEP